ncbi:MAG: hypothetical protein K6E20_02690 [Acholeplasmatales bacterium]|nr:hypothetical protein [Acholeplasmatales bacterium]
MEIANDKQKKEKEPLTTKQKVFLCLRIVGNVFFYSILLMLLIFSIMNINGGARNRNFPNIFGRGFLSVQSDSMTRVENSEENWPKEWENFKIKDFDKGDLVNVKVFKKSKASSIDVGDVITFYDEAIDDLNTHRVIDIVVDTNGKVLSYICQGDKAVSLGQVYYTYEKYCSVILNVAPSYEADGITPDINSTSYKTWQQDMYIIEQNHNVVQFVDVSNVRGVVYSINYGGGKTLDYITDHWLALFIIPVIIILVIEIFFVVRNIMILRGEKNIAALDSRKEEIIAEEKERMRLELLAEMYGGMENIPEEMKNPKKPEAPKEENNETTEEVENKELGNNETNEVVEETNNEAVKDDTVDVEEVENSSEQSPEAAKEAVEDKPEVESDVEPQDDKKEEE